MSYRKPQRGDRLARIAQKLDAGRGLVRVVPWYVASPDADDGTPAPGWYLLLASIDSPIYLGHNSYDAERTLRRHLEGDQ